MYIQTTVEVTYFGRNFRNYYWSCDYFMFNFWKHCQTVFHDECTPSFIIKESWFCIQSCLCGILISLPFMSSLHTYIHTCTCHTVLTSSYYSKFFNPQWILQFCYFKNCFQTFIVWDGVFCLCQNVIGILFVFCYFEMGSVCRPDWPGTCYRAEAGLSRDLLVSAEIKGDEQPWLTITEILIGLHWICDYVGRNVILIVLRFSIH